MYDNPNLPYRCPKCFNPVSSHLTDITGKRYVCGCMTCDCDAPVFTQEQGESIYMPRIKWDNWVVNYRNDNPDYHKEYLCKNCLRNKKDCGFYNEEYINCPYVIYEKDDDCEID